MKQKDAMERQQREAVINKKMNKELEHERQMKSMIDRIEEKQKSSMDAYQRNLDQKVKAAKDTNSKMEGVAQRAREFQQKKIEKKYKEFQASVKKFHEKLVIR